MKRSAISRFPFKNDYENNCLARAHTVDEVILSAIRAWLVTRKGSRLGSMVGCFLPDLLFDILSIKDLSGLSKELKMDLQVQFPGVVFYEVILGMDRANEVVELVVNIKLSTSNTQINRLASEHARGLNK